MTIRIYMDTLLNHWNSPPCSRMCVKRHSFNFDFELEALLTCNTDQLVRFLKSFMSPQPLTTRRSVNIAGMTMQIHVLNIMVWEPRTI